MLRGILKTSLLISLLLQSSIVIAQQKQAARDGGADVGHAIGPKIDTEKKNLDGDFLSKKFTFKRTGSGGADVGHLAAINEQNNSRTFIDNASVMKTIYVNRPAVYLATGEKITVTLTLLDGEATYGAFNESGTVVFGDPGVWRVPGAENGTIFNAQLLGGHQFGFGIRLRRGTNDRAAHALLEIKKVGGIEENILTVEYRGEGPAENQIISVFATKAEFTNRLLRTVEAADAKIKLDSASKFNSFKVAYDTVELNDACGGLKNAIEFHEIDTSSCVAIEAILTGMCHQPLPAGNNCK